MPARVPQTQCHINLSEVVVKFFHDQSKTWQRQIYCTVYASSERQAVTAFPIRYHGLGYSAARIKRNQNRFDEYNWDRQVEMRLCQQRLLELYDQGKIQVECEAEGSVRAAKDKIRVASVAAFNAEGQLLFGKRNDSGKWTLPGGHLEMGELAGEGALRELQEETGLAATHMSYLGSGTAGRNGDLMIHCYAAMVDGEATGSLDPDQECSEWQWVDLNGWKVPQPICDQLHAPKNVTLRLLGLQEVEPATGGGKNRGRYGWHTNDLFDSPVDRNEDGFVDGPSQVSKDTVVTPASTFVLAEEIETIAQELEKQGKPELAEELRTAFEEYESTDEWDKAGFDNALKRPEDIADRVHDMSKRNIPNIPQELTSYQPPMIQNPGFGGRVKPMYGATNSYELNVIWHKKSDIPKMEAFLGKNGREYKSNAGVPIVSFDYDDRDEALKAQKQLSKKFLDIRVALYKKG